MDAVGVEVVNYDCAVVGEAAVFDVENTVRVHVDLKLPTEVGPGGEIDRRTWSCEVSSEPRRAPKNLTFWWR